MTLRAYVAEISGATVEERTVVAVATSIGLPGPRGAVGPANTLTIGTVTTGNTGDPAAASITGTAPNQTLNLTLPRGAAGDDGDPGPANTLSIGTVTTGAPGTSAAASITGVAPTQTLNLTIPAGADGDPGPSGVATATTPLSYNAGTQTISISAGSVAGQGLRWSGSAWAISQFSFADITSTVADAQVTLSSVQQWLRSLTRGVAMVQATANESSFRSTGYSLTGSDTTAAFYWRGTWNTTGTPTLIDTDLTVTAVNSNAKIVEHKLNGSMYHLVTRWGESWFNGIGVGNPSTQTWVVAGANGVSIHAAAYYAFTAAGYNALYTTDLFLRRVGAGHLGQYNGTNAQQHSWYRTYTDAANFERATIKWTGNTACLVTEAGGTGTVRPLVSAMNTLSADPTATELPAGTAAVFHNSTSGVTKLWANVAGTLKSVTLT